MLVAGDGVVIARFGINKIGSRGKSRPPLLNARTDGIRKGQFRTHLKKQRCVIPAEGFYEWREEGGKQPYYFSRKDGRALTEHERPWLFLESASVRMRDPRTATVVQNNWFIKLHFKNVGRSPAIVTDCIFKIAELSTLSVHPDYSGAMQLAVQRTISVGESVDTDEVGPAPTAANRQGAQLVFFGKLTYTRTQWKGTQYRLCFARCAYDGSSRFTRQQEL